MSLPLVFLVGFMNELHFVFLGPRLPRYAIASIALSSRYSGVEVKLIGQKSLARQLSNQTVDLIPLEDFYSQEVFSEAARRVSYSAQFRGGFWLKSLERIFVLEQFLAFSGRTQVFHAELDQLLFRVDRLIHALEGLGQKGVFFPFHNSERAVASVFYCNDLDSLSGITKSASTGDVFPNEMVLLARWAGQNPDRVFALPTIADLYATRRRELPGGLRTLSSSQTGGFVDAAQIGQWVAGIDPRNVPIRQRPFNRFVDYSDGDLLSAVELRGLELNLDQKTRVLSSKFEGSEETPVYNLHIHSKIHPWLGSQSGNIEILLSRLKDAEATSIPGSRAAQLFYFFKQLLVSLLFRPHRLLIRSISILLLRLRIRPGSNPFVSGDGFRSFSNHVWEKGKPSFNPNRVRAGDVVFCEGDELRGFEQIGIPKIKFPFVLVLGNSDANHDSETLKIVNHPMVGGVFAQNLMQRVRGAQVLPIGLENAWRANNGNPLAFITGRFFPRTRSPRIMWTFTIETNVTVRTKTANSLLRTKSADFLGKLSPREHRQALARYAFVACPPGNGLDTHRVWEAMYLGCIPIILRSHLTEEYERLGLPVWVLGDFEELVGKTELELSEIARTIVKESESEALWLRFWKNQILLQSRTLKSTLGE